FRFKF
ncbi:hypothetical protein D020_3123B, partial [Vibrio parahaemolyticus SBR10290]